MCAGRGESILRLLICRVGGRGGAKRSAKRDVAGGAGETGAGDAADLEARFAVVCGGLALRPEAFSVVSGAVVLVMTDSGVLLSSGGAALAAFFAGTGALTEAAAALSVGLGLGLGLGLALAASLVTATVFSEAGMLGWMTDFFEAFF